MSNYKSSVHKYGNNKYRVDYSYIDPITNTRKRTCKRGFKLQREATLWEKQELPKLIKELEQEETLDENLTMKELIDEYMQFSRLRRRETTADNKEHIIRSKIIPYFANKKVYDITTNDVRKWGDIMLSSRKKDGEPYAQTYLRAISNQLSAILNYAVAYHGLKDNPVLKIERLGEKNPDTERDFWTVDEYNRFIEALEDTPLAYYAFEILFWCGIREGELLALTPSCFDFEKNLLHIRNSFYRRKGVDTMGDTKTKSSKRICTMPSTLAEEIKEYISSLYGVTPNTRIFPYTKKKLYSALEKGCKKSGVKRIEIHSIRHSNITLLENEIGSATTKAISSRCGHTNTKMTLHYAHIYEGTDQKIANELDEMMKERKNNKCQQKTTIENSVSEA